MWELADSQGYRRRNWDTELLSSRTQSHSLDVSELGFVPRLGALQPTALTHTLCCSGPGG